MFQNVLRQLERMNGCFFQHISKVYSKIELVFILTQESAFS